MKNILTSVLIVLSLFIASCSGDKETPKSNEKPEQSKSNATSTKNNNIAQKETSDVGFMFKISLKKGANFAISVKNDEEITQELAGQKQSVKQTNQINYDFKVKSVDEFGNFTADITIRRIQKELDAGNGNKQYFDSGIKDDNNSDVPPDIKSLKSLIGKKYSITLTPLGKVTDVKGTDKMINSIIKKVDADEKTNNLLRMALMQEFGGDNVAHFYEKLFNYIDGNTHKQGDKWEKVYDINIGVMLKVISDYQLTNISDNTLTIKLKSKLKDVTGKKNREIEGYIISMDVKGEQEGTIKINKNNGFISQNTVTQRIYASETRAMKSDKSQRQTMKTTKKAKYTITVNTK
jgi:hypothetical protein